MGFNTETGPSKDVGVALSMGQSEAMPIQPWTRPPKHPLSINHPLIGQSRTKQARIPADYITFAVMQPSGNVPILEYVSQVTRGARTAHGCPQPLQILTPPPH